MCHNVCTVQCALCAVIIVSTSLHDTVAHTALNISNLTAVQVSGLPNIKASYEVLWNIVQVINLFIVV